MAFECQPSDPVAVGTIEYSLLAAMIGVTNGTSVLTQATIFHVAGEPSLPEGKHPLILGCLVYQGVMILWPKSSQKMA